MVTKSINNYSIENFSLDSGAESLDEINGKLRSIRFHSSKILHAKVSDLSVLLILIDLTFTLPHLI